MEKTERQVMVREATSADAERLLTYVRQLLAEPEIDFILSAGEFTVSVEQERQLIERYALLDNCVFLLAEAEDRVIGILHCQGGNLAATRHTTRLAISVRPEWRNQGVGTRLMQAALAWARETGLKRIELEVFARNARAIHVYEQCGFQHEGMRRRAVYRYGQYHDLLMMAYLLEE
jgi:RimJ/RimL family protein N-acetyltransferase